MSAIKRLTKLNNLIKREFLIINKIKMKTGGTYLRKTLAYIIGWEPTVEIYNVIFS